MSVVLEPSINSSPALIQEPPSLNMVLFMQHRLGLTGIQEPLTQNKCALQGLKSCQLYQCSPMFICLVLINPYYTTCTGRYNLALGRPQSPCTSLAHAWSDNSFKNHWLPTTVNSTHLTPLVCFYQLARLAWFDRKLKNHKLSCRFGQ